MGATDMTPWLFSARPMVEWLCDGEDPLELYPDHPDQLCSRERNLEGAVRIPNDSLVGHRDFIDFHQRRSIVALIEFGASPARCASLVESSWKNGSPAIVWFSRKPSANCPHWREVCRPRSIETPESGRLVWRPLLSWRPRPEQGQANRLCRWIEEEFVQVSPPPIRIEFPPDIPYIRLREEIEEIAKNPPPCWLKILAIPSSRRAVFSPSEWTVLLDALCRHQKSREGGGNVIPLQGFQERVTH